MRAILFRGKRCDNGEWVYGDLAHSIRSANGRKPHKSWIVDGYFSNGGWLTPLTRYAVVDKSVGEYTGLKDRNGKEIFEGDMLAVDDPLLYTACNSVAVIWLQGGWYISSDFILPMPLYLYTQCSTIIGNIFDNPELVREAKK